MVSEKKAAARPTFTDLEALQFHQQGKPGKIEITPTKPMATQRDLSLAYSPGVAVPVRRIAEEPDTVYDYTAKGNLVAVISNGTAILGLGDLGALASKPVMEGKAVLFKRFADVDSIDLEIGTSDVDEFINAVKFLGPSFGGINLEDIKAPDCFVIEQRLREMMDIPVFHDDQHGTAIDCRFDQCPRDHRPRHEIVQAGVQWRRRGSHRQCRAGKSTRRAGQERHSV
jgi:malate dehydrogenase (oxaloacetate-decarboxylating)(NADP+)